MNKIPEFLKRLRLPAENQLTSAISELEFEVEDKHNELERLRSELQEVEKLKLLLAPTTGFEFHAVVTAALREMDSHLSLGDDDAPNLSWLLKDASRIALVNTAAVESGLSLADIGAAYKARADLDVSVTEMPLLLVANIYYNDQDAELKRRRAPIGDEVVREAAGSRILVLRSFDLWQLVAEKQAKGSDAVDRLTNELDRGGWLKAD